MMRAIYPRLVWYALAIVLLAWLRWLVTSVVSRPTDVDSGSPQHERLADAHHLSQRPNSPTRKGGA